MNAKRRTKKDTLYEVLRDPVKRRAYIIFQLGLKGLSLAALGRMAQPRPVGRNAVYRVFSVSYPKMERHIADALGVHPSFLFPERYDEHGNRFRGKPKAGKKP